MEAGGGSNPAPWDRTWQQIDEDFDEHLQEIRRFLRCPTVSASDDDMLAGAEFVAALIEAAGGTAEIIPTSGHPAVLGHIEGDGPRLLRYGMYDVQPADEPGWTSPPFAAVTADVPGAGPSIVARGTANSKGSLASFLLALVSARTPLPERDPRHRRTYLRPQSGLPRGRGRRSPNALTSSVRGATYRMSRALEMVRLMAVCLYYGSRLAGWSILAREMAISAHVATVRLP